MAYHIQGLNNLMAHLRRCYEEKETYQTTFWSSINEYPIMYALMSIYRPQRVFECGTCSGCSALSWAVGMKNAGIEPWVHTWDPVNRKKVYEGMEWEKYICAFTEPWVGDVASEMMNMSRGYSKFVFIDGDHSRQACREDAVHAIEHLEYGDVIAFHDAVKHPPISAAVTDAIYETGIEYRRRYKIWSSCGLEILEL